jgi:hypothetical protein
MTASYLACRSETTFSRAEALRRTVDPEAAEQLVAKVILDGECIWLHAGTPLQIVGSAENPLYVIVLPLGETATFVTYRRFLQKWRSHGFQRMTFLRIVEAVVHRSIWEILRKSRSIYTAPLTKRCARRKASPRKNGKEAALPEWQAAIEALMLVVDLGGPTMFAQIGVMEAYKPGGMKEAANWGGLTS